MIKIISVGTLKEKYLQDAEKEYLKRLSKYQKVEVIEIKEEVHGEVEKCLEKEGLNILKKINDKDFVITLEIEGRKLSSIEFANTLEKIFITNSDITFIIGSSNGLSTDIKKRSNYTLSFSDMTFPHQLFRILLLEQLYRSYKIINGESYHK